MTTIQHEGSRRVRATDLGTLYARYWDAVVAYLKGQGASEPEDLASDAFVGVLRGLDRFEGDEDAFRSWLFVIAHRRLIDQRRSRGRRPTEFVEPKDLVERSLDGREGNVEEEALARLVTTRVVEALEGLTDDQRTVLLMHAVGDLSLPQIAEILGKRLGAVKSLHHRGLAAAARALGNPSEWLPPR
jgi:RNA polymerase sigma factor (sigma-70 family)